MQPYILLSPLQCITCRNTLYKIHYSYTCPVTRDTPYYTLYTVAFYLPYIVKGIIDYYLYMVLNRVGCKGLIIPSYADEWGTPLSIPIQTKKRNISSILLMTPYKYDFKNPGMKVGIYPIHIHTGYGIYSFFCSTL